MQITFGPVPSRRLGRSLGIKHIPLKGVQLIRRYGLYAYRTKVPNGRKPTMRHRFVSTVKLKGVWSSLIIINVVVIHEDRWIRP